MVRIPITKPCFGEEELAAVQRPLQSGWVVQGREVEEFERRFREYSSAEHAAATTSCTTALHIAVAALGLGPGDEVVVPAFTWVSTANVVEYQGARPVFCDIDLQTFNLDPASLEAAVTERTVGIIPVHMFGLCAEMEEVQRIARRHGLWVVEDAACAFGAWYRGRSAGTLGDAGAFSFHPRKSITTGEGGMLTTGSAELDQMARTLRDHGASRSDLSRHESPRAFLLADFENLGFNYRMTDLQGALGCEQMNRAAWILEQRGRVAGAYGELLADCEWLSLPTVPEGHVHGWQSYAALFRPETPDLENLDRLHEQRNEVMAALEDQGIATRQGTHAAALLKLYRERYDLRREDFPNAATADRLSLALPLYPQLTEAEIEEVASSLQGAFEQVRA